MPTGYTIKIEQGCSFKEYILECAKNFGGGRTLCDEVTDKKLTASLYYYNKIKEVEKEILLLKKLTTDQIKSIIYLECEEINKENETYKKEYELKMQRYANIKNKCEAWIPPTVNHENLKKFAIEQINTSLEFEVCYQRPLPNRNIKIWYKDREQELKKKLQSLKELHEKEIERTEKQNSWLDALYKSIKVS
jgi:hypothetical protein